MASPGPLSGTVTRGAGDASVFVEAAADRLATGAGFVPYPGTLNLRGVTGVEDLPGHRLEGDWSDHCEYVTVRPCRVRGIRAAVVRPAVPDYPSEKTELLAPVSLRRLLAIEDGDTLELAKSETVWPAEEGSVTDRLGGFDGVVFDLDGTLVDLDVDWSLVHERTTELLAPHLDRPVREYGRNEIFGIAREHGRYDALESMIAERELDGADTAVERELCSILDRLECPVGVCTANARSAAVRALERSGVRSNVDVIVGRETVREQKPHPRPLAFCASELGVRPGNALFVGDDRTDALAARDAEMSYLHPEQIRVRGR